MNRQLWRPDGWNLEVKRKRIRHIYFRVRGNSKTIEISAPQGVDPAVLARAFQSKEAWIRRQVDRCMHRPKAGVPRFRTGEIHYFKGGSYPLEVVEKQAPQGAFLSDLGSLVLHVRPGAGPEKRAAILDAWYRKELACSARALAREWEPRVGKRVAEVRVRKMRTRWGSCNTLAARIWLNIALIRMKTKFLEYVLVHEMIHLLERHHNKKFYAHMDRLLPDWPLLKEEMNRFPL